MTFVLLLAAFLAISPNAAYAEAQDAAPAEANATLPFTAWLEAFLDDARQRGFADDLLQAALGDVTPLERVIQSDRTQAESTTTFEAYFASRVTPDLVRRGRELNREHAGLLRRVADRHGVPSRFLLAIWGMESRFGRITGRVPIFQALATLAWEPRRSDFFRGELFDALTVVARGYIDVPSMKGSWAGAMGQPQFMPSSYLAHAIDFDGDGDRDIWESTADTLASIANYLAASAWSTGETWGREVLVPEAARDRIASMAPSRASGCTAKRNMTGRVPLPLWHELGVTNVDGSALPDATLPAGLVRVGDRTFLTYNNYDALLAYNCAHHYALSVALLADRLR